jgi:NitT/TauT family transport system permease protein
MAEQDPKQDPKPPPPAGKSAASETFRAMVNVRERLPRWLVVVIGVLSIITMLDVYSRLSDRQHEKNPDDTTIPTWSQLGEGVVHAVEANKRSGERWIVVDSKATATRLFLGLLFGVFGAVLLGIHMGSFSAVEAFFVPPLSLLAKVPPTAALAVFFVMAGTDTKMYVAMIAFGILPTLAQSIYLAIKEIPEERIYKAQTLDASRAEIVWTIIFPEILPKIIDGIRLQIGPAMVFLIAAEMVVGDVGFGYRIRLQSRLLDMNVVYPYLACLAAFGFGMDLGLRQLQRLLCPWFAKGGKR